MDQSRREFLLKVAAGTAYAAPLVRSVAAPEGLSAQHNTTTGKGGQGEMKGQTTTTTEFQFGPSAPWSSDP